MIKQQYDLGIITLENKKIQIDQTSSFVINNLVYLLPTHLRTLQQAA